MTLRIRLPPKDEISDFCRRYHIRRLSIFGSALREDFDPDSDVDVLVEFEEGHTPGFFAFVRMEEELSHLFRRKVDLRTPAELSKYFRQEVLEMVEVQYIAGD
ncbi:MAG: nucleotidyltransferase family protein [Candidatus Thorarchaeota archaeon]